VTVKTPCANSALRAKQTKDPTLESKDRKDNNNKRSGRRAVITGECGCESGAVGGNLCKQPNPGKGQNGKTTVTRATEEKGPPPGLIYNQQIQPSKNHNRRHQDNNITNTNQQQRHQDKATNHRNDQTTQHNEAEHRRTNKAKNTRPGGRPKKTTTTTRRYRNKGRDGNKTTSVRRSDQPESHTTTPSDQNTRKKKVFF
jgi:hypothetical protein